MAKKNPAKKAVAKKAAAKKSAAAKKTATKKKAVAKKSTAKKAVAKKTAAKKPAAKKAATKKAATKKVAAKKPAAEKKAAVKKPAAAKKVAKKAAAKPVEAAKPAPKAAPKKSPFKQPFLKAQRQRLADLRDVLVDAMNGVQRDNLRNSTEGGSAFGQHQADAGSDAYDRDFALNMLSQEQDSLYEIDEAIGRLDRGVYGVCEMSGDTIPEERLMAIPFARLTVDCQARLEHESKLNGTGGRGGAVYGGSASSETFERILED